MSFDLTRSDTLCALATSTAPAALAVVRVSGPRAHEVCARVFRPKRGTQRDFVATLGEVVDAEGVVDECICTRFPAGKSYTGEPSVELSVHGGPVTVRTVLRALVDAGCRIAEPGELTLRAMLSGRIDLAQAEAVDDVIHAKTRTAQKAALRNLAGGVASAITPMRDAIVDALAEIEARLDFPDEDLGAAHVDAIARSLEAARTSAAALLARSRAGRLLHDGARVVLYGPPNAGKSTLLNALLGSERALVHDEPGTTRDVLEAVVDVGGIPVTLVDVAGVRPLDEAGAVEKLGIARAQSEKDRADVVIALVPATDADAVARVNALNGDIAVLSKIDLGVSASHGEVLAISAKTGAGLDALRAAIASKLGDVDDGEALLMRERQVDEVKGALEALTVAVDALRSHAPAEVCASELRRAARCLDRLLGRDVDVDVLDLVFSRFCIGK